MGVCVLSKNFQCCIVDVVDSTSSKTFRAHFNVGVSALSKTFQSLTLGFVDIVPSKKFESSGHC